MFEGSERLGYSSSWPNDELRFTQLGINIQVMWPGQANGYYHAEEGQEDLPGAAR